MKRLLWVPVLVVAAAGWTVADDRSGLPAWQRLKSDLGSAHARIEVLRSDIDSLQQEADALDDDAFAIERAIREDLGFALPGEKVVRLTAGRSAAAEPR